MSIAAKVFFESAPTQRQAFIDAQERSSYHNMSNNKAIIVFVFPDQSEMAFEVKRDMNGDIAEFTSCKAYDFNGVLIAERL